MSRTGSPRRTRHVLDNPALAALTGPHAHFAERRGRILRYPVDVSPWLALPDTMLGHVGLLAANVPYVPADEVPFLPAEARDHEPLVALDGGRGRARRPAPGGRRGATVAGPGGHPLVETSVRQAPLAVRTFTRSGLSTRLAAAL